MKQLLLTSLFLLGVSPSGAQELTEFSVTGTKWYSNLHYENFMFGNRDYSNTTVCYTLGTDTLIDGQIWKKFYQNESYNGAIREQDGQVWYYPNKQSCFGFKDGVPAMLYDFTLQVGDTLYYRNDDSPGFTREKTSDYIGYLKVMDVREEFGRKVIDFGNEQWIEGVGSVQSPFFDRWYLRPSNGSSSWETLYQMVSDGKTLFFNGEVANPNVTSWLREGMTWTQNRYNFLEQSRQITLAEEIRPGLFPLYCSDGNYQLFDALQEFNNKIYATNYGYHGYIELSCDFTLQEGDKVVLLGHHFYDGTSLPNLKYDSCTVAKVDSVEYGGILRKRLFITGDREDVWVEGIASLKHVLPVESSMFSSYTDPQSLITCFYDNEDQVYLHPEYIDCTTKRTENISSVENENAVVQSIGQNIFCTSPDASLLEVYTSDAVKIGQSAFQNGEAVVTVSKVPATYLYIVTYPDGRRESGKVMVK